MSEDLKTLTPEQIKEKLPYGAISQIVTQTGLSRNTVNSVINNISNYEGPTSTYTKVTAAIIRLIENEALQKEKAYSALSKSLQGCKI
jgi:hypothetical protein